MKPNNSNVRKAKLAKNDEFYTQLHDIENELINYKEQFKDKFVYCNCDTADSNFVRYFEDNRDRLGLTGFQYNWNDFRGPESVELLKQADIVVTNPPFSLFREYVAQLMEYNKQFLVLGPLNAVAYNDIFRLIQSNRVWMGAGTIGNLQFNTPNYAEPMSIPVRWFTNMPTRRRNEAIKLHQKYTPEAYPTYFNYNAINVSRVAEIPVDYVGLMGVPMTFIDKYNPEQFEIVGQAMTSLGIEIGVGAVLPEHKALNNDLRDGTAYLLKDGVPIAPYVRIIVRNKTIDKQNERRY